MFDLGADMLLGGEPEPVPPTYKPETPKPADSLERVEPALLGHGEGSVRGREGGEDRRARSRARGVRGRGAERVGARPTIPSRSRRVWNDRAHGAGRRR